MSPRHRTRRAAHCAQSVRFLLHGTGWLTDAYGWPWIFYINVPIGLLGLSLAGVVLRDPPYLQHTLARIDVVGIVLLAIGLTALQLFVERGERDNWFESSFIVGMARVALVTLVTLVWWELWVEEPVVNLRVLRNIQFTASRHAERSSASSCSSAQPASSTAPLLRNCQAKLYP